jgi:hypothetical protein
MGHGKGEAIGPLGKIPSVWWSYTAWTLYFLTFCETGAFIFYYLGWMYDVFQMGPLATMIVTIIQAVIYLIAFLAFAFGLITTDLPSVLRQKGSSQRSQEEKWSRAINYQATSHCFIAMLGALAGMVQAIIYYAQYNGDYGNPVLELLDAGNDSAYIYYKMILFWMTVVWLVDIAGLVKVFSQIQTLHQLNVTTAVSSAIFAIPTISEHFKSSIRL